MHITSLLKYIRTNLLTTSLVASSIFITACSTVKNMANNQTKVGHDRLYTFPNKEAPSKKENDRYKKLVILSTNDLNGKVFPIQTKIGNNQISSGGIIGLKSYINIFRREFKNSTLLLDSGSFLSKNNNHERVVFFYDYLGMDVVNLGLNELTLNTGRFSTPRYLSGLFRKSKFNVISSNIFNLKETENTDWKNIDRSRIYEVNGVKVGVLGMISQAHATKFFSRKLNGYYVQNMAKYIIVESNALRRKGAQIVILMASHGIDCTEITSSNLDIDERKVNFNKYDISGCESNENEMIKTLSLLPPGKIDLVLSSGKSSKVVNMIHDIPVMQNFGASEYISWAELYYDTKLNRLFTEDVFIRQPVQTCHQFFKDTMDCYIEEKDRQKVSQEEIIPAKFFGHKITTEALP